MLKNAYLIIAHNNWEQVKLQIKMLDSPNNDIFIHVNTLVDMPDSNLFSDVTDYSSIYFSKRAKVIWGGYGIFEAALLLLQKAVETGDYDYFHFMTGSDLPIKSNDAIIDFLSNNLYSNSSNGRLKTNYVDMHLPETNPKMLARVSQYNLCVPYWKNKYRFVEFIARKINRIGYYIQNAIRINRFKNKNEKIVHGSGWWVISDELANYILSNKENIKKQYGKMTFSADEFIVQTLVYNSDFNESIYNVSSPMLWEIDWEGGDGKGSPHVYSINDMDRLSKSGKIYARKFDIRVDEKIVEAVIKMRR